MLSSTTPTINVELLLDRLLSAATPSDCLDSLDQLKTQCRPEFERDPSDGARAAIVGNPAVLRAICSLLSRSALPRPDGPMETEGGDIGACELLLRILPESHEVRPSKRSEFLSGTLLRFHEAHIDPFDAEGPSLVPSLLDCLCASSRETSVYARVLSLQVLQSLLRASPGASKEQLMKAPEGINRLVDLLGHEVSGATNDSNFEVPEEVRNQAILFLNQLASSSSVLGRLITFSGGYDRALKIALESGGGTLEGGSTVATDCLELCLGLAYSDDVARELFLGGGDGKGNLDRLAMLLDLRGGERYLSEERNIWWSGEMMKRGGLKIDTEKNCAGEKAKAAETEKSMSGKRGKNRKDDDLDDILRGADISSESKAKEVGAAMTPFKTNNNSVPRPPVPYLTPNECLIADSICNLLLVLLYDGDYKTVMSQLVRPVTESSLSKRRARAKTISSHDLLTRTIVDCALYTLPPPKHSFISAVPTPALQQKALMTMAVLGSMGDTVFDGTAIRGNDGDSRVSGKDEETMKIQTRLLFETMPLYLRGTRVTAMERLMYIACTGAYRAQGGNHDDYESAEVSASLLSLNVITTFRSCLPTETACRMVLHALAPPPPDEADEAGAPLDPPVVTKIVTTLIENLRFLQRNQDLFQQTTVGTRYGTRDDTLDDVTNIHLATIAASGAAAVLEVLLTRGDGDATREMLLRIPPPPPPPVVSDTLGNPPLSSPEPDSSNNLIDFTLHFIAAYDHNEGVSLELDRSPSVVFRKSMTFVTLSLLKLLAVWIKGMPKAVSVLLSSPASVSLGVLVRSKAHDAVSAMSGLLLGLCLEHMHFEASSNSLPNMDDSAWTTGTIIKMIQSMGFGKYFGMLDEWKNKPLPLPYCASDEWPVLGRREFLTWYSNSVTQVRRRIVTTFAGDHGNNDADSDPDCDDAVVEGNASTKSLRKVIKNQTTEIDELQIKLEDALRTIDVQSSQIKGLKRLSEFGISVGTNDILSEYEERIAELENENNRIVSEAEKQSKVDKNALSIKDQEIVSLQDKVKESQLSAEESELEKKNLSEEMAGLSAAYHSLEHEYRSNSSINAYEHPRDMTASGEAASEDGGISSIHGDVSESVNNQIKFLQAVQSENTRLREDVRAANEWMTMAVSKMEEMTQENAKLAGSLEQAPSQGTNDPKGKDEEFVQQKALVKQLRECNKDLEELVDSTTTRVEMLSNEVEELKSKLFQQKEKNESQTLMSELEEVKAQNMSLTSNLIEFQSWSESAQMRLSEMEIALQVATTERDELKNMMSSSGESNPRVNVLQIELDQRAEELIDVRTQLERVQSQLIKESDANEAAVENLLNKLALIKKRNEDLASEKKKLSDELSIAKVDTAQSRLSDMEIALNEVTTERDELKKLSESSSENFISRIDDLQFESAKKTNEINDLRMQVEGIRPQLEKLRSELAAEKQLNGALVSEKEEILINLSNSNSEISSIKECKLNLKSQVEELHQLIAELKTDRESAESRIEELMTLTIPENHLEDDIIAITAERNEIQSHLDDLSEEYEQTKSDLDRARMENGNLLARNRALEQDNKSLEYQFSEASSKLEDFETLKSQLKELDVLFKSSNNEKESLRLTFDEMKASSEEAVKLWTERVDVLNSTISSLESQLEDQEKEALEAISQWEMRCSSLEGNGEDVIQQWQERTHSMESEIASLENQLLTLSEQKAALKESFANNLQKLQLDVNEKNEAIASYDDQIDLLTKEIISTRDESELVVKQWQDRSQELVANIHELNETLGTQQIEATEAISEWESRCAELNRNIEELELKISSENPLIDQLQERISATGRTLTERETDLARAVSELDSLRISVVQKENQITSVIEQLDDARSKLDRSTSEQELLLQTLAHKENENADFMKHLVEENEGTVAALKSKINDLSIKLNESNRRFMETSDLLALKEKQWDTEVSTLTARVMELTTNEQATSSKRSIEFEQLRKKCHALEQENISLMNLEENAMRECDDSKVLLCELHEELRCAKEALQSFSTEQFSAKATEMATSALRQQMLEIRSQYAADKKALSTERESRIAAEKAIEKLKADVVFLSQASEYDESVDIHVRKIAKRISVENTRKERQEMEHLRSALEQLKEELGACRWREREAEERASNARLQKSILEQEVCAAKSDMSLMEQAIEDLETSKIDVCVSMEYRIETLLNERTSMVKSYQDESASIKAQLARVNQEKEALIHNLDLSEKANAALTLDMIGGDDSESEVAKLQLERAQLLAKITDMAVDTERCVREAVAALISSAEAELIIEQQSRKSVECSLAEVSSELEITKSKLIEKTSIIDETNSGDVLVQLRKSLSEIQITNRELASANQKLKDQRDEQEQVTQSQIHDLKERLQSAEARLRSDERAQRFETSLEFEMGNLRHGFPTLKDQNQTPELVLESEKESIDQNIIAMYDYVVELKASIHEERQMYRDLLEEHEDLLALLGQVRQDTINPLDLRVSE